MAKISEFFGMGGYAGYVWFSYAVTAILLVGMLVASRRLLRSNKATYEMLVSAGSANNKDETVEKKT